MNKADLWTKNLVIITFVNFFMFFAFQLFPSALPPYLKSLGAPDSILGWLQGIMTAAILLVRPFAGIMLDKYGRKWIFIFGVTGMLLSTVAYWFFPVIGMIIVIRCAHGMVWGIANTACSTIASDNIPKKHFSEGMGYFSLASSIAMALAPAIALSLGMQKNIILASAFLTITIFLALLINYKDRPAAEDVRTKKISLYAREAFLPSAIMFLIMITWGAIITFLALYGAQKSIMGVGAFFTVYAISMLITRPFFGKLVDRMGFGTGIWSGVLLIPAALLLLSVSNSLIFFLICAAIYGIGVGAAQSSLQTMAIIKVPKDRMGSANATFFTGFDGGIGIGAVLAGTISSYTGYGSMFALMAIFPILAGILYLIALKAQKLKK
ncbi:MFS transporter [Anaerocolumna aminovalerica]|uniref:MFS transporter n=1 Tax=Anaerocolumna aminovalerica TaxID=1527 RepID=UPI000BE3B15E|nr:MFS transporter [Anaerocolumna aminovalerica]